MKKLLILIPMLAMLTSAFFSPPPVVAFAQEQYNSAVEQVESVRNTAADDEDEEEEQIGIEELLSELDLMDSRVFEMREAVAATKPEDFSSRLWALDNRKLFNHSRTELENGVKLF